MWGATTQTVQATGMQAIGIHVCRHFVFYNSFSKRIFIAVDYFVNQAPSRELLRLRKGRLQDLHRSAGLSDDPETLTKQEIVDAIITARDDLAELPPSSPYGRDDANSSECSSDDGNVAGGEETDAGGRRRSRSLGLRRHVTVHDVGRTPNLLVPTQGRSFSLGHTRGSPPGATCQIETRSVNFFL